MYYLMIIYLLFLITWFWFGYIGAKAFSRFAYSVYKLSLSKSMIFLLSFFGYFIGIPVIFCMGFDAIFLRKPILTKDNRNGR